MSDLEAIRRQVRAEVSGRGQPAEGDLDPALDLLLEAALSDLEPSDAWLEAVEALVEARDLGPETGDAAVSNALRDALEIERSDLASLRDAAGLSVDEAAKRLGISRRAMEQIEGGRPLGLLHVQSSQVAFYLDSLGVRRAEFLRWLATLLAARGPQYAYGYRPGERPTEAVISAQDDSLAQEFRGWASAVLTAK